MGWFIGKYEWVPAKAPVQLIVRINMCSTDQIQDFEEDLIYRPGFFQDLNLHEILSETAKQQANKLAASIRKNGLAAKNKHYPAHRIHEVEVVPCKWVEVEEKVPVKVSKIQPIEEEAE